METSQHSQLPEFIVAPGPSSRRDLRKISCPREGCQGVFWVQPDWFRIAEEGLASDGRGHRTRPCTYCWKPSWLPGEQPNQPESAKPKRIVKRRKSRA